MSIKNSFNPNHSKIDLKSMRPLGFHKNIDQEMKSINHRVSKICGWNIIKFCPICKSKNKKFYLTCYDNDIYECQNCRHKYSERIPKNLTVVYENEIHFNQTNAIMDPSRKYRMKRFGNERVKIIKKYKKNGKLLDFGCGTGWFIEYALQFFEADGYEPTKNLAETLQSILQRPIYNDIKNIDSNYYDIVTAFDVIEHVKSPKKTFSEFNRILKPGGLLLLFTPNSKSISFEVMREKQNLIIPPYHLHYFCEESMRYLAKENFKFVDYSNAGLDIADMYAFERDHGQKKYADFLKKNMYTLQNFIDFNQNSNHMRVALLKK